MKYSASIFILLFMHLGALAQDTLLPAERSAIYMRSGKKIDKITLWQINAELVEYIKEGNRSEVATAEVHYIESLNYRIEFDETMKANVRKYDLIILNSGDTIRGFVEAIDQNNITYIPSGKPNQASKIRGYHSYVLNNGDIEVTDNTSKAGSKNEDESDDESELDEEDKPNKKSKKDTTSSKKDKNKFNLESCCLGMLIGPLIIAIFALAIDY